MLDGDDALTDEGIADGQESRTLKISPRRRKDAKNHEEYKMDRLKETR
jgi:hypothetical protein